MSHEQSLELAMTHAVIGGRAERYLRPAAVRSIAERLQRWPLQPEACQSCLSQPATAIRATLPLCARCQAQREIQIGRDPAGLAPKSVRADEDSAKPELQGLAIVFNVPSVDLGGFTEIVRPVAADRMISERTDLRGLWNHNSDQTIARVSAGTMRVEKRTRGVQVAYVPPSWATGFVESVERRDISGQSFGFFVLDDQWHLEDGAPVREIFDMDVLETSPVSFPAYPQTTLRTVSVGERQQDRRRETEARLRLVS